MQEVNCKSLDKTLIKDIVKNMEIDKPVPARIVMTLNETGKPEDFIGLAGTLYRENLIFEEPRELRRFTNRLEYIIIFRDRTSFENWKKNPKIIEYWQTRFKEKLTRSPRTVEETEVIIEVDQVANCTCGQTEFYILQGRALRYDELTCNQCFKQLSYAKIPASIELENWQCHYQRVYLNWLYSSFLEKQSIKELTNYKKGKLNLAGEEIRKELATFLGKPVYMQYFEKRGYEGWYSKVCLLCGSEGVPSGLTWPSRICKDCNTVFGDGEE